MVGESDEGDRRVDGERNLKERGKREGKIFSIMLATRKQVLFRALLV